MLKEFLRLESAGGIVLFVAALLGLAVANSPLATLYAALLDTTVAIQIGGLSINKPFILWVNDGLMAIFFFLIGLEVKREVLEGELSSPDQIVLPGLGAIGGIVAPAAIYTWFNWGNAEALSGWAVASATDIAFALGILSLFGKRVPPALKVFLLTLAIFDDLAAIIIIAVFYVGDLSLTMLGVAAGFLLCGIAANRLGVRRVTVYVLIGVALWVSVLKSGVHATLAGVLIALCVPLRGRGRGRDSGRESDGHSPLRSLEADLHAPVAFLILPLFAFTNAGLALSTMGLDDLASPVALGIIAGLVLGNPIGILFLTGLGAALGVARIPSGVNWLQMAGTACICGIGFTMSLFIAGLAFEHTGDGQNNYDVVRLGILVGSALSAVVGCALLSLGIRRNRGQGEESQAGEEPAPA